MSRRCKCVLMHFGKCERVLGNANAFWTMQMRFGKRECILGNANAFWATQMRFGRKRMSNGIFGTESDLLGHHRIVLRHLRNKESVRESTMYASNILVNVINIILITETSTEKGWIKGIYILINGAKREDCCNYDFATYVIREECKWGWMSAATNGKRNDDSTKDWCTIQPTKFARSKMGLTWVPLWAVNPCQALLPSEHMNCDL